MDRQPMAGLIPGCEQAPLGGQPDSLLLKMTEKKVRRLYRRTF